jgi:hypothetical protein
MHFMQLSVFEKIRSWQERSDSSTTRTNEHIWLESQRSNDDNMKQEFSSIVIHNKRKWIRFLFANGCVSLAFSLDTPFNLSRSARSIPLPWDDLVCIPGRNLRQIFHAPCPSSLTRRVVGYLVPKRPRFLEIFKIEFS